MIGPYAFFCNQKKISNDKTLCSCLFPPSDAALIENFWFLAFL